MSCKNYTLKDTCGSIYYATCSYYQEDLPEWSGIDSNCVTVEDTIKELYDVVSVLKDDTFFGIDRGCIKDLLPDLNPSQKDINNIIQEELCNLKAELENKGITFCSDLDLKNLVDDCNEPPTTLCELLQIIINKITEDKFSTNG